jgi:hypothetical protein
VSGREPVRVTGSRPVYCVMSIDSATSLP